MKRITFKKLLAPLGIVAAVLGASVVGSSASAWGPERATFTMDKPATYPVFNSITDNPVIGDERNFVRVGEITSGNGTRLVDEVKVQPGKQYLVRIYFHNNASATYNDKAHNNSGVAMATRLSTSFPRTIKAGGKGTITGKITASNTNPLKVWDEAYLTADTDVQIRYVVGSSRMHNDWAANNTVMPSSMFTEEGTALGLNALNGIILGCEEYSGSVTYIIQADEINSKLDKVVSKDGSRFSENVAIAPEEEVTFKLTIKNTGGVTYSKATVTDKLPAGLSLVSGSVRMSRSSSDKTSTVLSDDLFKGGQTLTNVVSGETITITYKAKAGKDFDCKGTTLTNTAKITFSSDTGLSGTKEDTASVKVTKQNCEEEKKKPGFEINKRVSKDEKNWSTTLTAKPEEEAYFKITIKNTGNVVDKNVIAYDKLDAGMQYLGNSMYIYRYTSGDDKTAANLEKVITKELFEGGLRVGDLAPGETAEITYKIKFTGYDFKECQVTTLQNDAKVTGNYGDDASIVTVTDKVLVEVDRTDENCDVPDDCTNHPDDPECQTQKDDCTNHPDDPECKLPDTGPVEIVMAIAVIIGIGGGGFYLYRTKKSLKTIENAATGKPENPQN